MIHYMAGLQTARLHPAPAPPLQIEGIGPGTVCVPTTQPVHTALSGPSFDCELRPMTDSEVIRSANGKSPQPSPKPKASLPALNCAVNIFPKLQSPKLSEAAPYISKSCTHLRRGQKLRISTSTSCRKTAGKIAGTTPGRLLLRRSEPAIPSARSTS